MDCIKPTGCGSTSDIVKCPNNLNRTSIHTFKFKHNTQKTVNLSWDNPEAVLDVHLYKPNVTAPVHPDDNGLAVAGSLLGPGKIYYTGQTINDGTVKIIDMVTGSIEKDIVISPSSIGSALNMATVDPCTGWIYAVMDFNDLVRINPTTGHMDVLGGGYGGIVLTLAFKSNGDLYAIRTSTPSAFVYKVNKLTGARTQIGKLDRRVVGISFDVNDNLYAIGKTSAAGISTLVSVNQTTWTTTAIGPIHPNNTINAIDLTFAADGNLYTFYDTAGSNGIAKINVGTGAGTLVQALPISSGGFTTGIAFGVPEQSCVQVVPKESVKSFCFNADECGSWIAKVVLRGSSNPEFSGTVHYSLSIKNTICIDSGIKLDGAICGDVTIRGNEIVDGDEHVTGNVQIDGNLTVNGDVTLGCGLKPRGELKHVFDKENTDYIFPCDMHMTDHKLVFNGYHIGNAGVPVEFPMDGLAGNIAEGALIVTGNGLVFTNISGNDVTTGPWNFVNNIQSADNGVNVLKCGLDNTYLPGAGADVPDPIPPVNGSNSVCKISIDQTSFSGKTAIFDIHFGYSNEPTYDFINIVKNGVKLVSLSGQGPNASDPYLLGSYAGLVLTPSDNLTVEYFKDGAWYAGVDNIYFYIKNLVMLDPIPPSTLEVIRDHAVILDYCILNEIQALRPGDSRTVTLPFDFKSGDLIHLTVPDVYDSYTLTLCLSESKEGENYRGENYHAPVSTNAISISRVLPEDFSVLEGWYETDGRYYGLMYMTDKGTYVEGVRHSLTGNGGKKYHMAEVGESDGAPNIIFTKLPNYRLIDSFGFEWIFNPVTGELRVDTELPDSIDFFWREFYASYFRKIGNPDDRLSRYLRDLKEYDHIFNNPKEFFKFVHDFYTTGAHTPAFVDKNVNLWPEINPYGIDFSQIKRAFGGHNRGHFDTLYQQLMYHGITRKYNVKRLMHWPEVTLLTNKLSTPVSSTTINVNHANHGLLTGNVVNIRNARDLGLTPRSELNGDHTIIVVDGDNYTFSVVTGTGSAIVGGGDIMLTKLSSVQQSQLLGYNAQQHYDILGVFLDHDTTIDDWPRLMPGETVTIKGTGTRLDNIPLRLHLCGFHTNGRPDIKHVPDYEYEQWNHFSVRLPLQITDANKTIHTHWDASKRNINNALFATLGSTVVKIQQTNHGLKKGDKITISGANTFQGIPSNEINTTHSVQPLGPNAFSINVITAATGTSGVGEGGAAFFDLRFDLPVGHMYVTDIIDWIDDHIAWLSPVITWPTQFAVLGTPGSSLNGPDDVSPSTAFGPFGMDLGYLFTSSPMVADGDGLIIETSEEDPYRMRVHTPLNDQEMDLLLNSLSNMTIEAQHGPIADEMDYSTFVAMICELEQVWNTECHQLLGPWCRPSTNGEVEIFPTFKRLWQILDKWPRDPNTSYSNSASPPEIYPGLIYARLRQYGLGPSDEYSEHYFVGSWAYQSSYGVRSNPALAWNMERTIMDYPADTLVSFDGKPAQDLSGFQVDIAHVNYLVEPLWLVSRPITVGPNTGAPGYYFDAYNTHESQEGFYTGTTVNPDIVSGEFLIGIVRDDKVRQALGLLPTDPLPSGKVGYISHTSSDFSWNGDPTIYSWYDENLANIDSLSNNMNMVILACATVMNYFNEHGCDHIICDIRNTQGGWSSFMWSFIKLMGDDREHQLTGGVTSLFNSIEAVDIQYSKSTMSLLRHSELNGGRPYKWFTSNRDCKPSDIAKIFTYPDHGFPANPFFKGSEDKQKRVIWFINATTTSGTQLAYIQSKAASKDTILFDGDFGSNTQFIGYGCYYRTFSTAGSYGSFINWYGNNRIGAELHPNAPMFGLDRIEIGRVCYIEGADVSQGYPSTGGVAKALDGELGNLHQPHLKWDMNADIFVQDIGYTIEDAELTQSLEIADANLGARTNGSAGTSGLLVTTTQDGDADHHERTKVDMVGTTAAGLAGKYFILFDDVGQVYVWFSLNNASVDPAPGGRGIKVIVLAGDDAYTLAQKTADAVNADSKFDAAANTIDVVKYNLPWTHRRHPAYPAEGSVDVRNPLTFRDTPLERAISILFDSNASDHYYQQDSYGNIVQ
jgi:hypothetical protein